jgi:hypothetical protein
MPLFTVEE